MSPRRTKGHRPVRYHSVPDLDLVELLFTAGDELPREVVDEFLRRGTRVLPLLHDIVADKGLWMAPLPEWWAAVHATYILGATENPEVLRSLLTALRWADAFDCDWVTEDLPSMLGRLGTAGWQPLLSIVNDETAGPGARSIALASLAAISLDAPFLREEALARASALLADDTGEDLYLRQTAANVLLEFRSTLHRDLLVSFGKEEAARRDADPEYPGAFYDWEVDEFLESQGEGDMLDYYRRDWLSFYEPEEITRRQERWTREQEEETENAQDRQPPPAGRGLKAPCPCGSGKSFELCCYLKIH